MNLAKPKQKFQDWFTQQWTIWWGKQIKPEEVPWLKGPFGLVDRKARDLADQLATEEGLIRDTNTKSFGLIPSVDDLNLSENDLKNLSGEVKDFYENTGSYSLKLSVRWNPVFKIFGRWVVALFSQRIEQLNIPIKDMKDTQSIESEIINLIDPHSGEVKYKIWFRTFENSGEVLYSGVYSTCTLPTGQVCIKAVFPLPNGNATVIMSPSVLPNGALRLSSSGTKFGDPGFYFLLHDSKGHFWSHYIPSFRDELIVSDQGTRISAQQTLTLWHQRVLRFSYEIGRKN